VQKISELNYSMVRGQRELNISNYRDFIFMVMPKLNELFAAEYDNISHEVEELIKSKEKEQRLVSKNDPVDLYLQELQQKAKRVKALAQNEEQENLRMIKTFNGNFVEYGS
jgi:5'-deoxynucleotidase YfbR-like HD superfamily hydrolase